MAKRSSEPLRKEDKRKLNRENLKMLVGIFRFMKPYRGLFILGMIALGLSTFTIMSFPKLTGELVDVATGSSKYFTTINQVVITLVIVLLVQSIFSFIRVYTFSVVSERGLSDVRKSVYKKILWLPMGFFDSRRTGELLSRLSSDVGILYDTFSFTLAEFFRQILSLIAGTIIIFWLTPSLAVFMLLTFPLIIVAALFFGTYIRKLSRKTQDKLAEANVIAEESFHSIFVVKAFTNESFQIGKYTKAIREVVAVAVRSSLYRSIFISFVIFVLFGGIVAIGWHGANLVQAKELEAGELFSFVFYTAIIGFSIAGLGDIYAQLQRAIGASERVLDILAMPDEAEPTDDQRLHLSGEITFNNVSFSYPSRQDFPVLKELDFKIKSGEKIALVGKSGSGKSTIINLLMRFYPVTEGSIVVDGNDIQSYHLTGYRNNIGVVPQEVILFGGTIEENIAYGKPGASLEEIKDAARKANALKFIERFPEGFKTLVGERGVKLSGGQRQRIAIARAILKDPAILILDEATSSLDAQSEVLVQQALEKLMEGRTTIVIAHRLSTIKKVDRIFVINEGRLAEMGSHAELTQVNNGIYSTLLKLQLHES